jgi:hypothetical protein
MYVHLITNFCCARILAIITCFYAQIAYEVILQLDCKNFAVYFAFNSFSTAKYSPLRLPH